MTQADWYRRGHWRAEPLWKTLAGVAGGVGAKAIVSDDAGSMSLPEFLDYACRLCSGFLDRGLRRSDAVVIQSRNSLDSLALMTGCFAYGLVAIPLPPMFSAAQVEAVIRSAGARALVMLDEKTEDRLRQMGNSVAGLQCVIVPDPLAAGANVPLGALAVATAHPVSPGSPDADTLALYSSGSTGTPKGVVHSGNTLRYSVEALARLHGIDSNDRILVALEYGFVGGTILTALLGLVAGASVRLMKHWSPEQALQLVQDWRASYTLLMPTHVYDVMNCPALDSTDCRSLRRGILAGVPRHVREDAAKRFCARPLPMFGMSESIGHVTFAPEDPWDAISTLDGRTLPGTELSVRTEEGGEAPVGQVGDLFLRGPNRLLRYLGAPELTANAIDGDGWFRTGDRAMLDARGYMLFVGRAKEIIRRAGVTIIPSDIETELLKHPDIAEVAVVPVPDARLGEKACACVVPRGGREIDLPGICRHLEAQGMARYQWPELLLLFEALPRTPSLKVRRADLELDARQRLGLAG